LRWGNFLIDSIEKENNKVTKITATFKPEAKDFKKTKKTTWLAKVPELVSAKVFEFDHLISKAKVCVRFLGFIWGFVLLGVKLLKIFSPFLPTLINAPIIQLDDDEDFKNFVNKNSKSEYACLCDPCLKLVAVGDVIQLERKGFFRVDEAYKTPGKPIVLFAIPDGKKVKK